MALPEWLNFFKKTRKLNAVIIDETGDVIIKKVKYQNNTFNIKINGTEQSYVIDHAFTTYNKKTSMPYAFYYANNPHPIYIRHERNQDVDGIGFKKILDSKTIQDLFSDQGTKKLDILMILIIANIILSIIALMILFGVIKVGATAAGAA